MYKKITHNIVEEHFDHPLATEMKSRMEHSIPKAAPGQSLTDPLVIAFRDEVNTALTKLTGSIRSYVVSAIGGNPDSDFIVSQILTEIGSVGSILDRFYSTSVGQEAVAHLTDFAKACTEVIGKIKDGRDFTRELTTAIGYVDMLAKTLALANSSNWPEATVRRYLRLYAEAVVEQAQARVKKDWVADAAAVDTATNLIIGGPVLSGPLQGMPDFAEVFAMGIVRQFPDKFTQ